MSGIRAAVQWWTTGETGVNPFRLVYIIYWYE